jgi:hypothetical protein
MLTTLPARVEMAFITMAYIASRGPEQRSRQVRRRRAWNNRIHRIVVATTGGRAFV